MFKWEHFAVPLEEGKEDRYLYKLNIKIKIKKKMLLAFHGKYHWKNNEQTYAE